MRKNRHFSTKEDWLPVPQEIDAAETLDVSKVFKPDWVIVDNYALDVKWHDIIRTNCG